MTFEDFDAFLSDQAPESECGVSASTDHHVVGKETETGDSESVSAQHVSVSRESGLQAQSQSSHTHRTTRVQPVITIQKETNRRQQRNDNTDHNLPTLK